jgi:hypothetical protein
MTVNPGRHGPYPERLDPDVTSAYAAATGDDTASVVAGATVPVIFPAAADGASTITHERLELRT